MKVEKINNASVDEMISKLEELKNYSSIMLLACEDTFLEKDESISQLDHYLKEMKPTIYGGVFPGLLYKDEVLKEGFVIVASNEDVTVDIYENTNFDFQERNGFETAFLFADGLSSNCENMLEEVFDFYGYEFVYIGGGAGRLSFEQKPCIFTNDGMKMESTQIVFLKDAASVGVAHGYKPVGESFRVTSSEKNTIKSLNYSSPFEVYTEILKTHCNIEVTETNFLDFARFYPFGISKLGEEFIVRDPFILKKDMITCIGEIKEGSFIQVMSGKADDLVEAAKSAMEISNRNNDKVDNNVSFVVDCVSRYLHMEEDYKKELDVLSGEKTIGILSIGEISNNGESSVELYNKTCVVGQMRL